MLKKSIILVGVIGAGKTTIGKKLASELNIQFFDSDDEIVKQEHMTISDLFVHKGEAYFRQQEEIVIAKLINGKPAVISLCGDAFVNSNTRALTNEYAITIWLSVDSQILATRLSNEEEIQKRPLIAQLSQSEERNNKLQQLIEQRKFAYRQAHFVLDVSNTKPDDVVALIIADCLIKPKSDLIRAVVVGKTIRYSWSPYIHAFWLKQNKILGTYHPIEVSERHFATLIRFLRDRGYAGSNIAMPYKQDAFNLVDSTDPFSQSVSAINTISIKNGTIHGQNTDSYGFIQSIYQSPVAGKEYIFKGKIVVVLGAGGASRGVCAGLLSEGVEKIILLNRTLSRAIDVQNTFGQSIQVLPWEERHEALKDIHMLVNATSLGMAGQESLDLDLIFLPTEALVVDIVYKPLITQLLMQARARGNPTIDGLDMLLHQAVLGFEAWFGVRPQVTPMLREHIINLTSAGFTSRGDFIIPEKFVENERMFGHRKPYAKDDMYVKYRTTHFFKGNNLHKKMVIHEDDPGINNGLTGLGK